MTFKDCHGKVLKIGDVVATTIEINKDRHTEPFSLYTIRKGDKVESEVDGRYMILDGCYGWCYLNDRNPKDIMKLTKGIDIREMTVYFINRQKEYN